MQIVFYVKQKTIMHRNTLFVIFFFNKHHLESILANVFELDERHLFSEITISIWVFDSKDETNETAIRIERERVAIWEVMQNKKKTKKLLRLREKIRRNLNKNKNEKKENDEKHDEKNEERNAEKNDEKNEERNKKKNDEKKKKRDKEKED